MSPQAGFFSMKTYKIYTLGCKINQYDSGKLAAELQAGGLAKADKNADLAVINSCAVTETALTKSGRAVRLAKKENPKAKIVLAGCWTKVLKDVPAGVDYVIGEDEIASSPEHGLLAMTDRGRYFIKI